MLWYSWINLKTHNLGVKCRGLEVKIENCSHRQTVGCGVVKRWWSRISIVDCCHDDELWAAWEKEKYLPYAEVECDVWVLWWGSKSQLLGRGAGSDGQMMKNFNCANEKRISIMTALKHLLKWFYRSIKAKNQGTDVRIMLYHMHPIS